MLLSGRLSGVYKAGAGREVGKERSCGRNSHALRSWGVLEQTWQQQQK